MDERINKIEREIAVMAATQHAMKNALEEIAATLKELLSLQGDTRVMQARINAIDSETREAFKRVYKKQDDALSLTDARISKLENIVIWGIRSIFAITVSLSVYILDKYF